MQEVVGHTHTAGDKKRNFQVTEKTGWLSALLTKPQTAKCSIVGEQ